MNDSELKSLLAESGSAAAVAATLGMELERWRRASTTDLVRIAEGGRPFRITAEDKVEFLDAALGGPLGRTGLITVHTAAAFGAYANRFKDATTLVFADVIARKFTAVLSYYPKGGGADPAGAWDRHRVELPMKHTPNWDQWMSRNKTEMDQATFAQFLEDNIPDIVDPDASVLVRIARTLEAKVNATFSSELRPADGSFSFAYAENVESQADRGNLKVPSEITLELQPFEGSGRYHVTARFRFKLRAGKLSLWYELVRVEDVIRTAFKQEYENIEALLDSVVTPGMDKDSDYTIIIDGPAPSMAK